MRNIGRVNIVFYYLVVRHKAVDCTEFVAEFNGLVPAYIVNRKKIAITVLASFAGVNPRDIPVEFLCNLVL